ncbi:MAG: hypothetical protein ABI451_09915 [Dokdonella sp.]
MTAAWTLTVAMMFLYVAWYGRNMPYWEDWGLVPVLTGAQPFSLDWLTQQVLEHRFVLSRAMLYPIWWLSGGDFRGAMFVNAALLAAVAWMCVQTARKLRGRASYFDAFFPMALLNLGHHESLIFFVQLYFVLPVVLFLVAVAIIARDSWMRSGRIATCLGLCIAALPLNGGIGMMLAPPLLVWALVAAWVRRRERAASIPLALAALLALIEIGLYFVNYHAPAIGTQARSVLAISRAALEVVSVTFGPAAAAAFPLSGLFTAALLLTGSLFLTATVLRNRFERIRALGLLMALAGIALVVLGIGFGRSVLGAQAGFSGRYALLVVPGLIVVFLASVRYLDTTFGRLLPVLLFSAACAMLGLNAHSALDYAAYRDKIADGVANAIRSGASPAAVAREYAGTVTSNTDPNVVPALRSLQRMNWGPYRSDASATSANWVNCRETDLPLHISDSHEMNFDGKWTTATGNDPSMVLDLPTSLSVCGVRIRYEIANDDQSSATMQVFWGDTTTSKYFSGITRNHMFSVSPGMHETTIWIYDTIDRLRIDPDTRPCRFKLDSVTLLGGG